VPRPLHFSEIEVSNFALDAELVISVARMKTSNASHVSLSLKNIQGVITPEWKRALQSQGLNQGIVDLNQVVRPRMAIIDGLYAQDQNAGMVVKPVGLIIASNDLVAADATCARIMGFEPRSIEHIAWAENVGLGTTRPEDIEILGEPLENVIGKFTFSPPIDPYQIIKNSMGGIEIFQGEGCSSCMNELGAELRRFEEFMPYFKDVAILVGANAPVPTGKKHIILYGNCLSDQAHLGTLVHGCPPTMARSAGTGSLGKVLSRILKENSLRSLLARDVDL
jgi:hypothetical protein